MAGRRASTEAKRPAAGGEVLAASVAGHLVLAGLFFMELSELSAAAADETPREQSVGQQQQGGEGGGGEEEGGRVESVEQSEEHEPDGGGEPEGPQGGGHFKAAEAADAEQEEVVEQRVAVDLPAREARVVVSVGEVVAAFLEETAVAGAPQQEDTPQQGDQEHHGEEEDQLVALGLFPHPHSVRAGRDREGGEVGGQTHQSMFAGGAGGQPIGAPSLAVPVDALQAGGGKRGEAEGELYLARGPAHLHSVSRGIEQAQLDGGEARPREEGVVEHGCDDLPSIPRQACGEERRYLDSGGVAQKELSGGQGETGECHP